MPKLTLLARAPATSRRRSTEVWGDQFSNELAPSLSGPYGRQLACSLTMVAVILMAAGCGISTSSPAANTSPSHTPTLVTVPASPCPLPPVNGLTPYCSPESAMSNWVAQTMAGDCENSTSQLNCGQLFPAIAHRRYVRLRVEFAGTSVSTHPIPLNPGPQTPQGSPHSSPLSLFVTVNSYKVDAIRNDGNPDDTYLVQVAQQGTSWFVTAVMLDYSHGIPPP